MPTSTISTTATFDYGPVGPRVFKSSTNVFWVLARADGAGATVLRAYKSSNPSTSWTLVQSTSDATIRSFGTAQQGDVIHIAWEATNVAVNDIKYATFNMSTESFSAVETVVSDPLWGSYVTAVAVRSNGTVFIGYVDSNRVMGTDYMAAAYARGTSGSWSTGNILSPGTEQPWVTNDIVIVDDRVHFLYSQNDGNLQYQTFLKTLSSADVMSAALTLSTTPYSFDASRHVVVDDAGTKYVSFLMDDAEVDIQFQSTDNPSSPTIRATNCSEPGMHVGMMSVGTDIRIYFPLVNDLHYVTRTVNGAYGSSVFVSNVGFYPRHTQGRVIDRGGEQYFALTYNSWATGWDYTAYYEEGQWTPSTPATVAPNVVAASTSVPASNIAYGAAPTPASFAAVSTALPTSLLITFVAQPSNIAITAFTYPVGETEPVDAQLFSLAVSFPSVIAEGDVFPSVHSTLVMGF